jgi:hypothetical protein
MDSSFDPKRFPTVTRYLATLPNGLDSFPDAATQSGFFEYMRKSHPQLKELDGIPDTVRSVLRNDKVEHFIPEVLGNTLYLVLRDAAFTDDKAFEQWAYDANAFAFSKPWARVLMFVLSPTLIVMGAGKRWSAFHKGSSLINAPAERDSGRTVVHGVLEFPAGLFPDLSLTVFAKAFEAAVIGAKARNAVCVIEKRTAEKAHFKLSWDA